MKNAIIVHHVVIIVITWGFDPEDAKRAYTTYFFEDGEQVERWTDLRPKTQQQVSTLVDNFCNTHNLINWSN